MLTIFATLAFFSTLVFSLAALALVAPTLPKNLHIPSTIDEETFRLWNQSLEDRRLASVLAKHIPKGFEQRSLKDLGFEIGHMVDDESAYQALAPIQLLRMVGNLAIVWDRYRCVRLSVALRKGQPWRHAIYKIFQDEIGVEFWKEFRNRELAFYQI